MIVFRVLFVVMITAACQQSKGDNGEQQIPTETKASLGIVGDTANVNGNTERGIVIMGGGLDVDQAFEWMIERAGGGDFVVIRASGTDAYNPYIYSMGNINSVETLKIDSYKLANDSAVAEKIYEAEALFIAGGDQSDYVNFWRDSRVEEALNYLIHEKQVPVGGTSAGAAVLGEYTFSALKGTIYSDEALQNPYHPNVTLLQDSFIKIPELSNVIVDQHYLERNRTGRHITFMARLAQYNSATVRGIGVDERTAVLIDASGMAEVVGESEAVFLEENDPSIDPEVCKPEAPLTWINNKKAVRGFRIGKTSPSFDITTWGPPNAADLFFYYVNKGKLSQVKSR